MKDTLLTTVTFDKTAKTVDFSAVSNFDIRKVWAIINLTRKTIIYAIGTSGKGYSNIVGSVITLEFDTASHDNADILQIVYSDNINSLETALGNPSDASASSDNGSFSILSFIKRGMLYWSSLLTRIPTLGQSVMANSTPVAIASNQSSIPTTNNGTVFFFSSNNSTSNQLTAGSLFTGVIESVIGQPAYSLLFFSDQNATITLNQYQDAAGTKLVQSTTFSYTANSQFARSATLNGNYVGVNVQNTGGSTTTGLVLDTAYGNILPSSQLNNIPFSLNEVNGSAISLGQVSGVSSFPVVQNVESANGNITAQNTNPSGTATANSAVTMPLRGNTGLTVQVTGTYTGALSLQVTVDNVTWITVGANCFLGQAAGAISTTIASASVGVFQVKVPSSAIQARITGLAAMTGTASVFMRASNASNTFDLISPLPGGTNNIGTVQPGNTANTTPWLMTVVPSAAQGHSTFHKLIAAATTNATSVKASAGTIGQIILSNASAAVKYFKLYNKASAPTVGTDVPVAVILVPAGQTVAVPVAALGMRFATGIAYALTGGIADSDTTALTLNDMAVHIAYT